MLALNSADGGAVGALAPSLKRDFSLSNGDIGTLSAVVSVASAAATVPAGVLVDRVRRTHLLAASVAIWSAAMVTSSLAVSYLMLLCSRVFLGVVTATAGPAVASMTGDLYQARERGRILGWIQTGDLLGIGIGFILVGSVITVWSWRIVFGLLALAGAVLVVPLWRLDEPRRHGHRDGGAPEEDARHSAVAEQVGAASVEPVRRVELPDRPSDASLLTVLRYVLQVRTNVIVILASAVGYFFLSGLRIFAVVFVIDQYGLSHATASFLIPVVGIGAIAGLLAGGHLGDVLLRRGIVKGRVLVGAGGFLLTAAVAVPAVLTHNVAVALPLLMVGAFGLAAPNPPLDAVRLDIIHPALWGRAEAVRTVMRASAEATAPLLFGFLADHLAGGGHAGLQLTLLVTLPALALNGLLLLLALRTYPQDVASIQASLRAQPEA